MKKLLIVIIFFLSFATVHAQTTTSVPSRILPTCDIEFGSFGSLDRAKEYARNNKCCYPELPPATPEGCGITFFYKFLDNLMRFLVFRFIPLLAGIFVVWGGFVIMTSSGSSEKFNHGKKMITVALIGVVLGFTAYIIVNLVFKVLTGEYYSR